MEEFFARLKEHKIVQWALAYVAVAFALIPVTDVVAKQFGWPEAMQRGLIIVLTTGFFVTLVLAWYHGERGHGRIIRSEVALLAALAAIGLLALWRLAPTGPHHAVAAVHAAAAPAQAASTAAVAPPRPAISAQSVAVLPLVNESSDKDQQYFSDGLSESFITALSQFAGLKVISRNSSFQFRNSTESSKVIGEKLGVAHLLEGSVQRAGNEVRINAELVNAADGTALWSQHYDRPYTDLFKLQDDITRAVASALQARLLSVPGTMVESDRPPSGNLDAYNAFLQGVSYYRRSDEADVRKSIEAFNHAIALDPHYARAYAELSHAWVGLTSYLEGKEMPPALAAAKAAADKALQLEPRSASSHIALGRLQFYITLDWHAAEVNFQHAVQLAPNDAEAKIMLATATATLGQPERALALHRQALLADPRNGSAYYALSQYLTGLGRLNEAEQAARTTIALQPGVSGIYTQLAIIAILRGDAGAALQAAKQEIPGTWHTIAMTLALQIGSDHAAADAALKSLIDKYADGAAYQIAETYAIRKDPDHMFQWLDRAWATRDPGLGILLIDPLILRYKDDPRFAAFCKKVGLPVPGAATASATASLSTP